MAFLNGMSFNEFLNFPFFSSLIFLFSTTEGLCGVYFSEQTVRMEGETFSVLYLTLYCQHMLSTTGFLVSLSAITF